MLAINAGNLAIVSLLAAKGVDMEYQVPSPQYWNALFFAVNKNNKDIAKFCIECGLSPIQRNKVNLPFTLYHFYRMVFLLLISVKNEVISNLDNS